VSIESSLGYFFLFCWWLGVFAFNSVKTKKKLQNGDAQVFGGIEGMVSFFFVWCG
jgi:hypothetical protein